MEHKHLDYVAEFKATEGEDADFGYFEGYGSIFHNKDSHADIVLPGAFIESLKQIGKPALLWQHDMTQPIGVYTEAREDSKGLYLKGQINLNVQQGKEAYALIKQGAIKGMSIGFRTDEEEIDRQAGVRNLKKVSLYEVSMVTFPSNKRATVTGFKGDLPATVRGFEDLLQLMGYGRKESVMIAVGGFKKFLSMQRDVDVDGNPDRDVLRDADGIKNLNTSLEKLSKALKEA